MSKKKETITISQGKKELLLSIFSLPPSRLLNRILSMSDPKSFVRRLSNQDFFLLIKKIGMDDCIPLLELADVEKWQFVLDMEIWKRDIPDIKILHRWISLFFKAEPVRLSRFLLSEGELLACYMFFKSLDIKIIQDKDEIYDIPEGFFTLDGVYYFRAKEGFDHDLMEQLLRYMAGEDLLRFQALFLSIQAIIPSEIEEELYRLRCIRLQEVGLLPHHEAISIYSPLNPNTIEIKRIPEKAIRLDRELSELVPVIPLSLIESQNMLSLAGSYIRDPFLFDRIQMEFAGLCNRIISADELRIEELEDLKKVCLKVSSYLNLSLERLSAKDFIKAASILERHPLEDIFRVGFGMTLKIRWETEKWLAGSWFKRMDLRCDFWDDYWGQMLEGALMKHPRFYDREKGFRYFIGIEDLKECLKVIRSLMVLDSLFEHIEKSWKMEREFFKLQDAIFYPLLFNTMALILIKDSPSFKPISIEETKTFFRIIRQDKIGEKDFIRLLLKEFKGIDRESLSILEETLSWIWKDFIEEYEDVSIEAMDARFIKYLWIEG